jgi:carboxymethylenebutenolidase
LGELLTKFDVPHDVKINPGVGHGYMDDHAPEDQTLLLRFLARISGTRYDDDATVDARRASWRSSTTTSAARILERAEGCPVP